MNLPSISSPWLKALVVILCIGVIVACKFYFKVSDSNPVEVAAEEIIKEETGYDVSGVVAKM